MGKLFLIAAATCALAVPGMAAVTYEGFNYAADSLINGQGTAGNGWAGAWYGDSDTSSPKVFSPSLTYTGLTSIGGTYRTRGNRTESRDLAAVRHTGDVWVAFLADNSETNTTSGTFEFGETETNNPNVFRIQISSNNTWTINQRVNGAENIQDTLVSAGSTSLFVILFDYGTAGQSDTTITLWINPTFGGDAPTGGTKITLSNINTNSAAFSRLRLYGDSGLRVDEIRIGEAGDSFATVVAPIPEPASAMLISAGALGLLARKNKQ